MRIRRLSLLLIVALAGHALDLGAQGPAERWVGTWATADTWRPALVVPPASPGTPPVVPQASAPAAPAAAVPAALQVSNQTLRQIVRASVRGDRARVVFSNAFGTLPVAIGGANLALRDKDAAVIAGSGRPLTFSGRPTTTLPAGAVIVSDPVALDVPALTDLAVDVFLPGDTAAWTSPLTVHGGAFQTNYVSVPGNFAGAASFGVSTTTTSWFLLSRVEVAAPATTRAIVTLGDSITDGTRSTVNSNSRWPDELARRLQADPTTRHLSVLNAGIAGNRLLSEANPSFGINVLARFDRDVLAQPGAAFVVVLEGINDIGMTRPAVSADDLIGAYRQLIDRAHAHGLKIFGATLTPFEGAAYFTPAGEVVRQAVNQWIRTSKSYDGVIDFDAVIRDPAGPSKFLPAYNSGDNLHPNDAGYKAMGQAVDLALFK